jgi:hypothetical protein
VQISIQAVLLIPQSVFGMTNEMKRFNGPEGR